MNTLTISFDTPLGVHSFTVRDATQNMYESACRGVRPVAQPAAPEPKKAVPAPAYHAEQEFIRIGREAVTLVYGAEPRSLTTEAEYILRMARALSRISSMLPSYVNVATPEAIASAIETKFKS